MLEEILVAIARAVVEVLRMPRARRGVLLRLEEGIEAEVRGEHEGTAVVGVVAHVEIGDRRLRRGGTDRRMRVDDAGRRVEARIGNTPDADTAVMVRHVLEQPVDAVVHVAAFVDIGHGLLHIMMRRHLQPAAFGHVAAAHVLEDVDVAGLVELLGRADVPAGPAVLVDTVAATVVGADADAVRRAHHQERIGLAGVLRHIDHRVQAHAVAHRDAVLVLRVMRLDVEGRRLGLRRLGLLLGRGVQGQQGPEQQAQQQARQGKAGRWHGRERGKRTARRLAQIRPLADGRGGPPRAAAKRAGRPKR